MRILLLSFYYAPDLCAGSFRAEALVAALQKRAGPDVSIDVITTMPNRYQSFARSAPLRETQGRLEIQRIELPRHRSDMAGQSKAFFRYARHAMRAASARKYDLVVATSSRLMTAALGAWTARRQSAPLYLDIRDIFVDTIADVLPAWSAAPAALLFSGLESWTMRRAARINLVSRGFEGYFRSRYPDRELAWFTNGVDDEFVALAPHESVARGGSRITILYAGNIGEGQSLHAILPGLAQRLGDRVRFVVIGDGGRKEVLRRALQAAGTNNVELRDPAPRAQLILEYQAADVLFLHLGAHPAFEKVLPSKLFEYAALGKPVLAGVAGYAAQFVREEITNAAVFAPGDVGGAVAALDSLQLVDRPRPEFIAKYARANIARAMADDILSLLGQGT